MKRKLCWFFILLALVLSKALAGHGWSLYIDPLASLVIAAFILLSALGIFSSSVNDLLDHALEEESQIIILRELVRFIDEYEQLHGIRTRRSGSQVFIDLFLEFSPSRTVAEIQPVINRLTDCLQTSIPGSRVSVSLATQPVA